MASDLNYLIDFASRQVNCNLYYNNIDLQGQLEKCYNTYDEIPVLNLFDQTTLETFHYFWNEFWALIVDVIPFSFAIANSGNDVAKNAFLNQIRALDLSEIFMLLFQLKVSGYFNIYDNKNYFEFIISSIKTLKYF